MRVSITTLFEVPPERVWKEVQKPALLEYVASPLLRFEPVDPPSFPDRWEEGEYRVEQRLFGVIPLGTQSIRTSFVRIAETPGEQLYQIRDHGSGEIVSTWEHLITIRETSDGKTVYTDEVEIDAGVLTPLVWLFAQVFYRYRQYRWQNLIERDFNSL